MSKPDEAVEVDLNNKNGHGGENGLQSAAFGGKASRTGSESSQSGRQGETTADEESQR